MWDQQSLRSVCAYAQTDQSLCLSLEYSMTVKLLTEHHLEFQSLTGGCTRMSESTLVKMPHCWKSHVAVHFASVRCFVILNFGSKSWSFGKDEPVQIYLQLVCTK